MCSDGLLRSVGQVVHVSNGVNLGRLVLKYDPVSIEAEFVDDLDTPRNADFSLESGIGSSEMKRGTPLRINSSVNAIDVPHENATNATHIVKGSRHDYVVGLCVRPKRIGDKL